MFFAHALATQVCVVCEQRSLLMMPVVVISWQSLSTVQLLLPMSGSIDAHGSGPFGSSRHTMSNVMPATCACARQPRPALLRATKSSVSWISVPDRYITTIVFSNGNTLYIASFVSGPRSKSARMPSEFVIENSASTPSCCCIARATRLPSWLSPFEGSLRRIFAVALDDGVTYENTPLRSMSWLILTEYGHSRFAMSGSSGTVLSIGNSV